VSLLAYTIVAALLLLGAADLVAAARTRDADRIKRARLAGAAAWMFGVGGSAMLLASGFSGVAAATPETKAAVMAGVVSGAIGPAVAGTVGGMLVAGLAAMLGERKG
jgi:hypothetical protein